jgi:hypothetical protein
LADVIHLNNELPHVDSKISLVSSQKPPFVPYIFREQAANMWHYVEDGEDIDDRI